MPDQATSSAEKASIDTGPDIPCLSGPNEVQAAIFLAAPETSGARRLESCAPAV